MIKAKEDEKFISQALRDILTITVPLIISLISGGLMGIINAYFIGHIGTKE
jgi:Na+-driven multidrug efflux pump